MNLSFKGGGPPSQDNGRGNTGMGYAQSRYVKQSVLLLSSVWAAVFSDRALIITMYTTLLDYDKSSRMAFQTFPAA